MQSTLFISLSICVYFFLSHRTTEYMLGYTRIAASTTTYRIQRLIMIAFVSRLIHVIDIICIVSMSIIDCIRILPHWYRLEYDHIENVDKIMMNILWIGQWSSRDIRPRTHRPDDVCDLERVLVHKMRPSADRLTVWEDVEEWDDVIDAIVVVNRSVTVWDTFHRIKMLTDKYKAVKTPSAACPLGNEERISIRL